MAESRQELLRHELLADVEVHSRVLLLDHGVDKALADQVAIAIADFFAGHWGGITVVFPKDYYYKLAERDLEIWHQFNGTNHVELAKKYQMTERGIRKILDKVKKRYVDRNQGHLFDNLEAGH